MTERRPSLSEMVRYFGWLGTAGFGGPIALVARMERELVGERRWLDASEFKDGLAFSQLAPGPLAAQLAIYLGWLWRGALGATACGVAFIAPSLAMVIGLAELYQRFGGLSWLQGAWYGVGAVIIAIIARSAWRLSRRTLGNDLFLWVLFGLTAFVTAWREAEVVLLFVACGILAVVVRRSEKNPVAVPALFALGLAGVTLPPVRALFLYFASAGLFVFGSGLAIVPLLHGGVVEQHQWLTERQFLDSVAVALITPGPVVIAVAFMGFLIAGLTGALAAAAGVFAPVYVITLTLAPRYQRLKSNPSVQAFIDGVTAAAIGAIAGSVIVLGSRAIVDWETGALAVGALGALLLVRRLPEPLVIAMAAAIGIFGKGTQTMKPPATVVFVCEHGTVKSVVALEHFNREARARGLPLIAISRGTHPDSTMPESVHAGLTSDGFDVSGFHSHAFTAADLNGAQLVVALDAEVEPVVGARVPILRWDGMPAVTGNYVGARSAIASRVSRLVDSLIRDRAKSGR